MNNSMNRCEYMFESRCWLGLGFSRQGWWFSGLVRELEGVLRETVVVIGLVMVADEEGGDPINSECDGLLAFFSAGLEGRDDLVVWKETGGVWGDHAVGNPRLDVSASGLTLTEDVVGSEPLLSGVTGSGFTFGGRSVFFGRFGVSPWDGRVHPHGTRSGGRS
jgi:hypothetical protein